MIKKVFIWIYINYMSISAKILNLIGTNNCHCTFFVFIFEIHNNLEYVNYIKFISLKFK